MRDCILYRLARAVAGYYQDKNWFMLEGLRNSGKGVLIGLLETAIGEYMTSCDSSNFLSKGASFGNDAAKENMFLFNMQLNRIINVQEFKTLPNKPQFINGSVIKSICSGGDRIETRAHYGMPIKIRCQSSLLFAANEYPDISPQNAIETCTVWGMDSKFVDDTDIERVAGYMYYPRDNTIKQFITKDGVGLAFIHILIDALEFTTEQRQYPASKQTENAEANDQLQTENTASVLAGIIKFTNIESDFISNTDIATQLSTRNIVLGKMVLSRLLKGMGGVSFQQKSHGGQRGYSRLEFVQIFRL